MVLLFVTFSASAGDRCASVVLSSNLRPYLEILEGMKRSMPPGYKLNSYFLKDISEVNPSELDKCPCKVAVGLKAVKYLSQYEGCKIYSLILYPWLVKELKGFGCGAYLEVPPELYVESLRENAPWVKRAAVVFSDEALLKYVKEIQDAGNRQGIKVSAFRLSRVSDLEKLGKNRKVDAAILIPDPVLSTESAVRFVVDALLRKGVLVVGYNEFFARLGAGIAIATDYRKTGAETATLLLKARKGECSAVPSVHKVIVNKNILKRLGRKR